MAEKSYLWTTGGAGDGASTYTRDDWSVIANVFASVHGDNAIAPTLGNGLSGTVPTANTVRINTGGAICDGKPYYNSSTVDINIPSAIGAGNTRIDRIVLRCDWTAQTVRLYRIAGVDAASPTPPAVTRNPGSVYDLYLYQALVNTSGTVTLTDERDMAWITSSDLQDGTALAEILDDDGSGSGLDADLLDGQHYSSFSGKLVTNGDSHDHVGGDGAAIGSSALSTGAVTETKIGDGAVTANKIGAGAVTETKIADGAVTVNKIGSLAVSNAKLANDSVDDTKVGNRVPMFTRRQGGDASGWGNPGTTNYTPTAVKMQAGSVRWTGSSASSGSVTVTLPQAFSDTCLIFAMATDTDPDDQIICQGLGAWGASSITIRWVDVGGQNHTFVDIHWLAIGPE